MRGARLHIAGAVAVAALVAASAAEASNGLESPDVGVVGIGRGNATLVRSDDPLAAHYNPSALSRQATGVHAGVHFMFVDQCFERQGPGGAPVSPGGPGLGFTGPGAEGGPPAELCESVFFPNPQIAANFRLTDDLALGVALVGPHGVGNLSWPESIDFEGGLGTQPAPSRYLLVESESLLLLPTVSLSYNILDELSVGAGFVWGIASIEFVKFVESISNGEPTRDDFGNDVRARFQASDLFVPGFVLGATFAATPELELAAYFKASDSIRAKPTLELESLYWNPTGTKNEEPCPAGPEGCNLTRVEEAGSLEATVPMQAKLGIRYHHPRSDPGPAPSWAEGQKVRDMLSQDLFDLELNLTWANNSSVEAVSIQFNEGIAVAGTPGTIPTNGDIERKWKDVLGVRVGGDFVVLPSLLALRAGGFFESKGQEDEYLNLDFHLGERVGLGGGGTVRLGPVDVSIGYQHTFFGAIDNGGSGLIPALSGDRSTGGRSRQAVNGGRFEQSLNEVALGGTLRF